MGLGLRDSFVVSDVSITYNVAAGDTTEATLTVPGVKTGDFVLAQRPADSSTLFMMNARVSAANTVKLTLWNTGGSTASSTETLAVLVIRPERHAGAAEL